MPATNNLPFDLRPIPSATLSDLNRRSFDLLAATERSDEQRLAAAKMVAAADDTTPTVLGLLVLGLRPRDFLPGSYIQFLRIAGNELGDPIQDELVIDGPIEGIIRRIDDKMTSHNRLAIDFTSSSTKTRTYLYPPVALQQIVRNAVMHRTYEATNAPIHVYWFDDRIEIMSPGGPYGLVTAETFGQPSVVDYRNPNLAEYLRVLGLVQRFGFGIPTAQRELAKNGNLPLDFEVGPHRVLCRIRGRW